MYREHIASSSPAHHRALARDGRDRAQGIDASPESHAGAVYRLPSTSLGSICSTSNVEGDAITQSLLEVGAGAGILIAALGVSAVDIGYREVKRACWWSPNCHSGSVRAVSSIA